LILEMDKLELCWYADWSSKTWMLDFDGNGFYPRKITNS
jgi:hypothetical protein